MQIRLLKDNKELIKGKTLKKGTILGITTEKGRELIDNKEAESVDLSKGVKKLNVPLKDLKDN